MILSVPASDQVSPKNRKRFGNFKMAAKVKLSQKLKITKIFDAMAPKMKNLDSPRVLVPSRRTKTVNSLVIQLVIPNTVGIT